MAKESIKEEVTQKLDAGTYEVIQGRLQKQKTELQKRLKKLNQDRKEVFGSLETKLISNDRINTENNCIARDIVSLGNTCLFGYNVHFGLRTDINLKDVMSVYRFQDNSFQPVSLDLLKDDVFETDFKNLYKYYRNTIFSKFAIIGNYLYMVFQLSDSVTDIKTFKWLIKDSQLHYVDNRSDHEYKLPTQHEFKWQEVSRDMHRQGLHAHVSILDRVFVETIGGDLTIKIEDNTDDGKGIYSKEVVHRDQTLDDGQYKYADLGNLVILDIKPFQEDSKYFVYNHKLKEVQKISSIKEACVLLPDDHGIIFPTGFYLQTGEYHIFENDISNVKFQQRISSPNGEDYMYVFYSPESGLYNLMSYNVISQKIQTPIICNGFTILENGELCYFKNENEQSRHHLIQIWQTPYSKGDFMPSEHKDSFLFKIGNKDIVKAMAEVNGLINLLNKEDNYNGLYSDVAKQSKDILDAYYWLNEESTQQLNEPLNEINQAANAAIDEFQKVLQLKKNAKEETETISKKADTLFNSIKSAGYRKINDFVTALSQLRELRGEVITLKEIRYIDTKFLESLEQKIEEETSRISERCVRFLLDDKALHPYEEAVKRKQEDLNNIKKVVDAKKLEEDVNQISQDLELLINIVSNLEIDDTSHSTKIINNISLIFATINQLKAEIKGRKHALGEKEAQADFAAQIKLIDQSIINYLDVANSPQKCDEFQTKISVKLEELEGKFADFEEFIGLIIEKREEVYNAFEGRKNSLIEKRNKKAISLQNSAQRILKGVQKKAESFSEVSEINAYFASDILVNKARDIAKQLQEMEDSGKAEEIQSLLKSTREDSLRKLKDKKELYEDGESVIRFGKHKFGVNNQELDLTVIYTDGKLKYHLTGTDFYQKIDDETLLKSEEFWHQDYISENEHIYRGSYLAYKIFLNHKKEILEKTNEELLSFVQEESSRDYSEGYVKGVHDVDATKILSTYIQKYKDLDLLRYHPEIRACAQYFWNFTDENTRNYLNETIKASGNVISFFPEVNEQEYPLEKLEKSINEFLEKSGICSTDHTKETAKYIFEELQTDDDFQKSRIALDIKEDFLNILKEKKVDLTFRKSLESFKSDEAKVSLVRQWVKAFLSSNTDKLTLKSKYVDEVVCLILFEDESTLNTKYVSPSEEISGLIGEHSSIERGVFTFNYHDFTNIHDDYFKNKVPAYLAYKKAKHEITIKLKKDLKLEEFKPRILSSFVRNKLIDQVYFPLFGDNLAKQLGTVGDTKRTDRMGLLLLISPPGYGKTTLMEYIANRLGLVFVKINGPAIGHDVTSVDPASASNSAAREELKKLNLALEMGNNVMLYLDDIQHCSPEFLQKFISLSDGTRKIEGVYNGNSRTYDMRDKKFCVVMAGNPYTESGEKFRIPDMLANRADIYNLGDIIGDTAHLFRLSLIENSLTSNPVLQQLGSKNFEDVYRLIDRIENENKEVQLTGNYTNQEIQEYISVLEKVIQIRNTVLKVNDTYIKSAAMEDEYRTEPAFKLQGSYRDMNKLVAKVVPIMNKKELETLVLSHYESESQTLTSSAEANLLKFKELTHRLSLEEEERWAKIRETFQKNNKLKGLGDKNEMAQLLAQLMQFSENLEGIQKVLQKGFDK
ncbi:DNA repair ATPase [Galbibacter mesophilus]|uniref:DNA repair ATPase n=1 Tax=Galbibacter mesophilus TaxID=379069 RepID=UPI00191DDF1F|nr:DNA repair ATPase [Galbibacter mesophilus]MCM5661360.1 DNA repair ATPase [Galbibacter mesophilus]